MPPHRRSLVAANIAALVRAQLGFPYAAELAEFLPNYKKSLLTKVMSSSDWPEIALRVESRRLVVRNVIAYTGVKRTVALAGGASTNGLELTEKSDFYCIETDFFEEITRKKAAAGHIVGNRPNLVFAEACALTDDIGAITDTFLPPGEILIIAEAVAYSLPLPQCAALAYTVRETLRRRGGQAVITDILTKENLSKIAARNMPDYETVLGLRERIDAIPFEDMTHVISFFQDFGLRVAPINHSWTFPELICLEQLKIERAQAKSMLEGIESIRVWLP